MKKIFLSLMFTSQASFAGFPSPAQMKQNFEICAQSQQWLQNWGQYVVAFDIYEASEICRDENMSQSKLAPCKLNGKWTYAGYYCEERSPQ